MQRHDLEEGSFPRETIHSGTDLGGVEIKSDSEDDASDQEEEEDFEEHDIFIPRGSYFDRSIELEHILEQPNESGSEADGMDEGYEVQHHEFHNSSDSEEDSHDFFNKEARFRHRKRRRRAKDDLYHSKRSKHRDRSPDFGHKKQKKRYSDEQRIDDM